MKDKLLSPGGMLVMGGLMGILSKLSDVGSHMGYLQIILSEMTSQMSLWILIGVTISLFSRSRKLAMANIFLFCMGMLAAYYVTAEVTHSVYHQGLGCVCLLLSRHGVPGDADQGEGPFATSHQDRNSGRLCGSGPAAVRRPSDL